MDTFEKNLFTELRTMVIEESDVIPSDKALTEAITDNENLISLGFCLKPADIVKLAKAREDGFSDSLYEKAKVYTGDVKAKPMYPDFPKQVLEMDEAQYRFHQMVHYFSTYGIEGLFGVEVRSGWLPDVKETEKTKKQDIILPSRILSLIDKKDQYVYAIQKILSKRERMTVTEADMVKAAVPEVSLLELADIKIPFKENLMTIFYVIFNTVEDRAKAINLLHSVCQHTGDVMKCIRYTLTKRRYSLTTSERKMLVKLLESYPVNDFRANLILSRKKAENSKLVTDYISFNKFSRSPDHAKALAELKRGDLRSWKSTLHSILETGSYSDVLAYAAQRPGELVRMVRWLIREGVPAKEIAEVFSDGNIARSLSVQTLVSVLTIFGKNGYVKEHDQSECDETVYVLVSALSERLKCLDTPLRNKKVFIDQGIYNLSKSELHMMDKSSGYIRSGLAFDIPETVKAVRFFTYWNDKKRVDVDLHAIAYNRDGKVYHIGWNSEYREIGVVMSGDMTESDSAEFIDVDMSNKDLAGVYTWIDLYSGRPSFKAIETCFTGMMGVSNLGEDVELYSAANCFYSHDMDQNSRAVQYAAIDVKNRVLRMVMQESDRDLLGLLAKDALDLSSFTIKRYLDMLCAAQEAVIVDSKEDADVIIRVDKGKEDKEISLIDENYFADVPNTPV